MKIILLLFIKDVGGEWAEASNEMFSPLSKEDIDNINIKKLALCWFLFFKKIIIFY